MNGPSGISRRQDRQEGNLAQARRLHEQSVVLHRQLKNQYMLPTALANLAMVLIHFRELDRARELIRECWLIGQMEHSTVNMVILGAAFLANAQGRLHRAARLLGYNEAQRALFGTHIDIGDRPDYDRNLASLRAQLDEATFQIAWTEGQALTQEQAIELALSDSSQELGR